MLKPAVCSVVNSCSGSAEVVGIVLLLLAILIVVLTPLLLVLGLTYFAMQRARIQELLPPSSHHQRSTHPVHPSAYDPAASHAPLHSGYRKAA